MPLEFRPKLEKIVELLLHLAHIRPGADKYQAVKFFYLADKEHIQRYGRPITQERYVALPFGPVASTALDLLNGSETTLAAAGLDKLPFRTEEVIAVTGRRLLYIREPLREVDFDVFSKSDIKVFNEIIEKYGEKSFDELYNITHDHYAYKRAWNNRGSAKASDMTYEDMIESPELRERILADIGPVSANM